MKGRKVEEIGIEVEGKRREDRPEIEGKRRGDRKVGRGRKKWGLGG